MKKFYAFLLVLATVLAFVPAFTVSAAETVVYLKDGATGDGSTPDKAVGTLDDAFAAIGADNDGVIVVVGSFNYPADANWTEPAHTGKITITGKYSGTDYAGVIVNSSSKHWILNGPTVFDDFELNLPGTMVIRAWNNPIEFTENFRDTGTQKLYLVGGNQGTDVEHKLDADINITINGGTFLEMITFARSSTTGDYTGTAHVWVGGNAKITKLVTGNRSIQTNNCGSLDLTLDGGVVSSWIAYGDSKTCFDTGTVTIYVTKNFKIADSFNDGASRIVTDSGGNGIFYGINGASAFYNDASGYSFESSMQATSYLLKADPEVYDEILASDKLNKASFTEFEKVGSAAETTASTTAAVTTTTASGTTATTAVVTTTAEAATTSADSSSAPSTGDISGVIICAMLLAAAACVIILKKKSRA